MKKKTVYLLLAVIIVHSAFVFFSMNQPFHGDEVAFFETAKEVLKTGKPVFNYSVFKPGFQGLWHTPLYIYLISIFMLMFGKSIYSVRAVSALFNVLTVLLVFLITKEIFKKNEKADFWALFAAALYALNPLTIQSSIPLDIDAGLLNFSMYLFLYFFIKNKNFYYLIPSLLFVFLSKESGPIVLFLALFLFLIATDWKKIPKMFLLFFISGILFLFLFYVYSTFLGLDFSMPFKHNLPFFKEESQLLNINLLSLVRSVWSLKTFFYFAVPFFVILFFIFTFIFYYKILKTGKNEEDKKVMLLNILSLITIGIFFYLGASGWGFPKYYITALPAMSVFSAYMISKEKIFGGIRTLNKKVVFLVLFFFLLLLYFLMFIPYPLIPEFDSTAKNMNVVEAIELVGASFILYAIFPFVFSIIFLHLFKFKREVFMSLIFLSFFMFFYLNINHALVDHSTYYRYGDIGVMEVVNYFKNRNISASEIATHMHIGSYLGVSDYYEITFVYNNEKEFREKIVDNENINYIVIWERDIERIGENMRYFKLEKKIGTYYIFKRKNF